MCGSRSATSCLKSDSRWVSAAVSLWVDGSDDRKANSNATTEAPDKACKLSDTTAPTPLRSRGNSVTLQLRLQRHYLPTLGRAVAFGAGAKTHVQPIELSDATAPTPKPLPSHAGSRSGVWSWRQDLLHSKPAASS